MAEAADQVSPHFLYVHFHNRRCFSGPTGVSMRIITGFLGMLAAGAVCTSAMAALSTVNTGFESPSFTTGGLNGQPTASPVDERWLVSGGGANANVNVSTVHPKSGSQHIRITPLATQNGAQTGAFS